MTLCSLSELLPDSFERYSGTCPTHGEFSSIRRPNSDFSECPHCKDEQVTQESREQAKEKRIRYLTSLAELPLKYVDAGLRNFETPTYAHEKAVKAVTAYTRNLSPNKRAWEPLIIAGTQGTGKTHLVCALANNAISKEVSVRYTTSALVLSDIRSAYGKVEGKTEASQILRYINDFDLLILDEADMLVRSDNDLGLMFSVINGRYNNLKPLVVVTNQPPGKELGKLIGVRSMDRIVENSTQVICDWESHRKGA